MLEAISGPVRSKEMAVVAIDELSAFDWREIARETIEVYALTCGQLL